MLSALVVLFLTFDAVIKVLRLEIVAQSAVELGSEFTKCPGSGLGVGLLALT